MRASRVALIAVVAWGCGRETQPRAVGEAAAGSASVRPALVVSETEGPTASAMSDSGRTSTQVTAGDVNRTASAETGLDSGPPAGSATPIGSATAAAPSAEPPPDPQNKLRPPLTSADLSERAAHLLDAIVKNEPPLADDFFFPKAPFIPLKDVADPGRYFDQLLATYHRDVAGLRGERKDWSGAEFVSFELGTPPTWVAPGKEYNKVGYFRTFGGKLRYRIGEKTKEIVVSTIISWGGRWYVTHLSPIRH